jgi:hypothetical protein
MASVREDWQMMKRWQCGSTASADELISDEREAGKK